MTATTARRGENLGPALAAAAALHLGVLLALILFAQHRPALPVGGPVTIHILAEGPAAPQASQDLARGPAAPEAPPAPPSATPSPRRPAPTPKAASVPPPPRQSTPAARPQPRLVDSPPKAPPPPRAPALDLDALAATLAPPGRAAATPAAHPARVSAHSSAAGTRAAGDPGMTAADVQGLQQLLNRLWNPNCSVEGGDAVTVPVRFTVGRDGRIVGRVTGGGAENASDPIVYAAARRAIDAVHQAEPFERAYRGQSIQVIFNARKACGQG